MFSTGVIVSYASLLVIYPMTFVYMMLNQWRVIRDSFKDLILRKKNYVGMKDAHSIMMSKYKGVPDWWFLIVLLVTLAMTITIVKVWPLQTPVWVIFFLLALNGIFLVPATILNSVTGFGIYLNTRIQLLIGYIFPGNPEVLLFANALGAGGIDSQATSYISDQKLAHYSKIPPRAVFRGQLLSTIIVSFAGVSIQNWNLTHVQGLCTPDQPDHFTCGGYAIITFSSSVEWALLVPVGCLLGCIHFSSGAF